MEAGESWEPDWAFEPFFREISNSSRRPWKKENDVEIVDLCLQYKSTRAEYLLGES